MTHNIITELPSLSQKLKAVANAAEYEGWAWNGTPFLEGYETVKHERVGTYDDTNFIHLYRCTDRPDTFIVLSVFVGSCEGCISQYVHTLDLLDEAETDFIEHKSDEMPDACEAIFCNKLLKHALTKASIHTDKAEALAEFMRVRRSLED